ncbi:MAG: phage portal protein family protein [Alphaproteobacteria bacterium]
MNKEHQAPKPSTDPGIASNGYTRGSHIRGYMQSIVQSTDPTLSRIYNNDLNGYKEILRDDQVWATMQQRIFAVTSKPYRIVPGGGKKDDLSAAALTSEVLEHVQWDTVNHKMLFGTFFGRAVAEKIIAYDGRHTVIDKILVRDANRYGVDRRRRLRIKIRGSKTNVLLDPRYYWWYSCGGTNDDEPMGVGLGHWLYWLTQFKRGAVSDWAIFLEKWAQPTIVGWFPAEWKPKDDNSDPNANKRTALLESINSVATETGVLMPNELSADGTIKKLELQIIEAARSGSVDYNDHINLMNLAIAKVVLGQTMTTDNGSSWSQADVHKSVRKDIILADSQLINNSANKQVIEQLVRWNYPNAALPKIERDLDGPEDTLVKAKVDKAIFDLGYKPTATYIYQQYGPGWEADETHSRVKQNQYIGKDRKDEESTAKIHESSQPDRPDSA